MFRLKNLLLCIHLTTILATTAETMRTEENIGTKKRTDPSKAEGKLGQTSTTETSEDIEEIVEEVKALKELIKISTEKLENYNLKLRSHYRKPQSEGYSGNMRKDWGKGKFSTQPYKQAIANDLRKLGSRALRRVLNLKESEEPSRRKRYYYD